MGGSTISTSATRIDALKLQSSSYGVTVALCFGLTRVAGNLLDYAGFKAVPHTSTQSAGGKGGSKTQNTTYSYSASVALGICHGLITGIPRVWVGSDLYAGGFVASQINDITESFTTTGDGYVHATAHASQFLGTVSVIGTLDSGPDSGSASRPLAEGTDYTLTSGVYTFHIGALPVNLTYQYLSPGFTQSALEKLGLSFIPGAIGQAPWAPWATVAPTHSIGYSGLAIVAGQDYDLGVDAQVANHLFEIQAALAFSVSSSTPDADPADIVNTVLPNSLFGAAFPAQRIGDTSQWSNYNRAAGLLVSPALTEQVRAADFITMACRLTNTGVVWNGSKLDFVPYGDQLLIGNGRTFMPNTTPIYDLNDDHFLDQDDPVLVTQKPPSDLYNHIRIEYCDRGPLDSATQLYQGQYSISIAEAKDQADIDANGLRSADVEQMHWICDADVAQHVAQLLLKRSLFIPNTYSFRLPVNFALAGPMALLTLTDPDIGLNMTPVRVIERTDDEDGELGFVCEDFPLGVASATLYAMQRGDGYQRDYNVDPGDALPPVIFESPGALTVTGLEICVATNSLNPDWGGCQVWASYDGATYQQLGTVRGGSRYGKLAAPIGSSLDVVILNGQLLSGSASDAAALATLCYIGGATPEWIAYETATLTGPRAYRLSLLILGAYDTTPVVHSANDPFVRFDDAVARSGPLDPALIGKTIHIKLCSFNVFGGAVQGMADVSATTYVITGAFESSRGGIRTFRQEATPVHPHDGDLWIQPSTGIQSRWNALGSTWESAATIGTSDIVLIATGACTVTGNTASKVGGSAAWDSQVYGRDSYHGGMFVTAQPAQTNANLMFGLNSDPTADASYASLDYAIYMTGSGALKIYESGVDVGYNSTYAANDVFAVVYDGSKVNYLQNGTLLRTVSGVAGALPFFVDTSFNTPGAVLKGIRCGPMSGTDWANIGGVQVTTAQVAANAATEIWVFTSAAGVVINPSS